jgi:hypothetical protein
LHSTKEKRNLAVSGGALKRKGYTQDILRKGCIKTQAELWAEQGLLVIGLVGIIQGSGKSDNE